MALPLVIVMGLVIGRRGNGRFCLLGAECLIKLAIFSGLLGLLHFPLAYFVDISGFANLDHLWTPLLTPAGYGYGFSFIVWCAAIATVILASRALKHLAGFRGLTADKYCLAYVKWPCIFLLAGAFLYLISTILENWPFGGLPQGLSMERAAMAITRHSVRQYFMGFCPAGALGLIFAPACLRGLQFVNFKNEKIYARRWLAFWAFVGCLPYCVQTWGLVAGLGLRGTLAGNIASGMGGQLGSLIFLTMGIVCWAMIMLGKRVPRAMPWGAFALLVLADSVPAISRTWAHILGPV